MTGKSDQPTPASEHAKVDTTGEFFSVGVSLHAVRAGYVRRGADNLLYETVVSGRYAHVIAPDRSGKSSLTAATAARLENNGFKVAILDLEQIGVRDAASDAGRWYYSVAYRLLRQLRIRVDLQTWWQDKSILGNRQRLVEFYAEIILQNVQERIVVFVDEIQCIGNLPFADQLLESIRAAHNARATDPEFARLTFVLLGECDPLSLIDEPEQSPFNITQPVSLADFSRDDLNLFATELNLSPQDATVALDRIYHWTAGQPYLSQKLARSISRENIHGDIAGNIDRIVANQLSGRAALHSEPHMSHIHRELVNDDGRRESLLNLFGRIRMGGTVATDLGSPIQRRLIAVGLIVIDEDATLKIRNRIYESVFTARWANENLTNNWRPPAIAAAAIIAIVAIPFWYTQLLPRSYVDLLTSETVELVTAEDAFTNFRSFPGHVDSADNMYRNFLRLRARSANDISQISAIAAMAEKLPDVGRLPDELLAGFWDRQARTAMRFERRDTALLAVLESLILSTPQRRSRAAMLVSGDYPQLIASLPVDDGSTVVFNSGSMLLTQVRDAQVSQWSLGAQGLQRREDWTITALEVLPLVRRVIVDRQSVVRRIGLTLNLSHARVADLRIKLIAPSGRAVEIDPGVARASSNEDIRIPPEQLREFLGEPLNGTWSLSVRDEEIGVAGQLVGWTLTLDSQGLVEDFQRGLNISDPVERDTDNLWFSVDGRFAIARAMQSDSVRVWDLAFAKPVRAVAVNELEKLIGLSAGASLLATATQDTVNLWSTATGRRVATLPVGPASMTSMLTEDGEHLFVQRRSDTDTRFELWSLSDAIIEATLDIAGTPALVSLDLRGHRIAVADYDRAVRVWNLLSGELIAQIDLAAQPSQIRLAAGGESLGVVFGDEGVALWRTDRPQRPLLEEFSRGRWQLEFSPSGSKVLVGRPEYGFQVYDSRDGYLLGPLLGSGSDGMADGLLGFGADEQIVITGGPENGARFWRAPAIASRKESVSDAGSHTIWSPSGDAVAMSTPDASIVVIGDHRGDVHILASDAGREGLNSEGQDVSYLGHSSDVRLLSTSPDGSLVASAADDNTIRIWNTAGGLPKPFFGNVPGNPIDKIVFSPDALLIGILSSNRVHVMDTSSGVILARFDLGERHQGMAFADSTHLYVGSDSGALRAITRNNGDNWSMQMLWQGDAAIRWLEASPRSRHLVLVDQNNLAQQFSLSEGKLGAMSLQLPNTVEEVTFAPGGSRVLFRTPRWIHRASSAGSGLIWLDAMLAPKALDGARMVFGDPAIDAAALGNRVYLPVAGDGFVHLAELKFGAVQGPGLFGNKDKLVEEWRRKFGAIAADGAP
ncbi:MAG: AAA-like domain-containing protein [Proteobacteria bacterium]|nr:AAA-like domain-containing protein [Pseudomonadota bacterium]